MKFSQSRTKALGRNLKAHGEYFLDMDDIEFLIMI